jgi:hypothetical protein
MEWKEKIRDSIQPIWGMGNIDESEYLQRYTNPDDH